MMKKITNYELRITNSLMGLRLEQVVPWGRSLDEYTRMFDLTEADLQRQILDCAGGPASFNAEMTRNGRSIISCDPIYQFSAAEIQHRVEETYSIVLEKVQAARENFIWTTLKSPEEMGQRRLAAMRLFVEDFPLGLQQNRYRTDELPVIGFETQQFDLALCSHLLFTYSDQLSLEFHLTSILEMCRVSTEVRIFPLLVNVTGETSPFLVPIVEALSDRGYRATIQRVPYEFQRGGNEMLKIVPQ
jgi:hypothetical protein